MCSLPISSFPLHLLNQYRLHHCPHLFKPEALERQILKLHLP